MAGNSEHIVMAETTKFVGVANYSVWKFCMRNVLQKEDLWDIFNHNPSLENIVVVPATLPTGVNAAALVAAHTEVNRQLTQHQTRALAILCLSVRDKIVPYINEHEDPAVVWTTLKSPYETSHNARRLLLKNKL